MTNDQPPRRRNRRSALPAVSEIEALISQTRALRLKLMKLSAYEALAEPAKAGVESLSKVGVQLERIIELVASAKTRKRRSRKEKPFGESQPKLTL